MNKLRHEDEENSVRTSFGSSAAHLDLVFLLVLRYSWSCKKNCNDITKSHSLIRMSSDLESEEPLISSIKSSPSFRKNCNVYVGEISDEKYFLRHLRQLIKSV